MDLPYQVDGADRCDEFRESLARLADRTAWTEGEWDFGGGDARHRRAVQNNPRDIAAPSRHPMIPARAAIRARRSAEMAEPPLFASLAAKAATD